MESIYKQEVDLHIELRTVYKQRHEKNANIPDESMNIVDDGLCWASISKDCPSKANNYWPENLWKESAVRILFLLKEPNGKEGEDYKEWDWAKGSEIFGNTLAYWLEGIMKCSADYFPQYADLSTRKDILQKFPLAIMNLKKVAGDSSASWEEIWHYAEQDADFLKRQIQILNPNVIVCCGSNDCGDNYRKVISIAEEILFPEKHFDKVNLWCHFCKESNLLLIDSYHPSYPISYVDKMDKMFYWVSQFQKNNSPAI